MTHARFERPRGNARRRALLLALGAPALAAAGAQAGEAQSSPSVPFPVAERDEMTHAADARGPTADTDARETTVGMDARLPAVRLVPQVGLHSSLSGLGQVLGDDEVLVEAGRRSGTASVGLALEVGGERDRTVLRGGISYGSSGEVPVRGEECADCAVQGSVLAATAGTLLRPLPEVDGVRPHLVLGGGLKRHSFRVRGVEGEGWQALFRDQTRITMHLGMGAETSVGGVPLRPEVNGFLSRFRPDREWGESVDDSRIQADVFLTLSIPFGTT